MKTFAEQLQETRAAKGMTQEDLANAAHVSRSTISHWEHGRAMPDLETLRGLSQIMGVNFLLVEEEETAPAQSLAPAIADAPPSRHLIPGVLGVVALSLMLLVGYVSFSLHQRQAFSLEEAYVSITPLQDSAYLVDPEENNGFIGWILYFAVKTESDVAFLPDHASCTFYNGTVLDDRLILGNDYFLNRTLNGTMTNQDEPVMIAAIGVSERPLTHVVCTVYGTDANGHDLAFQATVNLIRSHKNDR